MQVKISHRGNTFGPNPKNENKPDYIMCAIGKGYEVEVDVWYDEGLYLGHDRPTYRVSHNFFNRCMWLHCKNKEAFEYFSVIDRLNSFIHTDGVVKTTKGYLWTAPGILLKKNSIAVMPELVEGWDLHKAVGVCTDYPINYA
jgi:hypothetical protein